MLFVHEAENLVKVEDCISRLYEQILESSLLVKKYKLEVKLSYSHLIHRICTYLCVSIKYVKL